MPIYMDRHDVSETVTAIHVAQIHTEDLKIQHKFDCRGLTYWFDENRKTAFCLIEAPNKKAIRDMHSQAHGDLPHTIIEVDDKIVESFLGRIEDPHKAQKTKLNIINDPAFRILMVTGFKRLSLNKSKSQPNNHLLLKHNKSILKIINRFNGRVVKQGSDCFLVSFESVTKAVLCAMKMNLKFKELTNEIRESKIELKIGLSAGAPVTGKGEIFEDIIKLAERLCNIAEGQIAVSPEVKDLYESENLNVFLDKEFINALNPSEEKFLNHLMDYTEKTWSNTELKVDDFSINLGLSKSQLYRKMISLTGKSLNTFIKEYRLKKALILLNKKMDNISQIAFDTGFNSPAYFSKCFQETYGIPPSNYIKQHI